MDDALPHSFLEVLDALGFGIYRWGPWLGPLWFVKTLMLFVIASPVLGWMLRRKVVVYSFLTLAFLGCIVARILILPSAVTSLLFLGPLSIDGIFCFSLGFTLRIMPFSMPSIRSSLFFLIIGVGLRFLIGYLALSMSVRFFEVVGWLSLCCVLVGVWGLMTEKHLPKCLTSCSFPIYILHMFFLHVFGFLIRRVHSLAWFGDGVGDIFLHSVLAIVGSIIVTLLFRKFFSKTAAVFFGGR